MANLSEVAGQLTNFEVYLEGTNRLIGIASVDLPEVTYSSQDLTGVGIFGTISMPSVGSTDSLELTINWRSIHSDLSELNKPTAQNLVIYGSQHIYDHSTGAIRAQQVKISFRGLAKSMTLGSFTPNEMTETTSVFEIITLKVEVDGEEAVYLDKLNYAYRVNGVDYLADTRSALGFDW